MATTDRRGKAAIEAGLHAPAKPVTPVAGPEDRIEVRVRDLLALVHQVAWRHRPPAVQEVLIRICRQLGWQGGVNFELVPGETWPRFGQPCDYPGCDQPVRLDERRCWSCQSLHPLANVGEASIRTCALCPATYFGTADWCQACIEADYRDERRGA